MASLLNETLNIEQATHELEHYKNKYLTIFENNPDLVMTLDIQGNIIAANQTSVELLGYPMEDLVGHPFTHFSHESFLQACQKVANEKRTRSRGTKNCEIGLKTKAGKKLLLSVNASGEHDPPVYIYPDKNPSRKTIGVILVGRDITTLKKTEEEMNALESQLTIFEKSIALQDLVSGIAHEINNPASAVQNNLQVLKRRVSLGVHSDPTKLIDICDQSLKAIKVVTSIVSAMRDSYRSGGWRKVDLNQLVEDQLILLNKKIKYDITVKKNLEKLPQVYVYSSEINQVIINLLSNAVDAVQITKNETNKEIRLSTSKEGEYVMLRVEDTGIGITEEQRKKLFQPYYTTKGVNGTGMGLNLSLRIMEKHKGKLFLESSNLGEGSVFCIKLPMGDHK